MAKRSPVAVASAVPPKRTRAAAATAASLSPSTMAASPSPLASSLLPPLPTPPTTEERRADSGHADNNGDNRFNELRPSLYNSNPTYIHQDQDVRNAHTQPSSHPPLQPQPLLTMATAAAAVTSLSSSSSSTPHSSRTRSLAIDAHTADRHSCLAAPYSPTNARTSHYFDVVISKANAPVYCASAGKLKGKAIFADSAIPHATRIWTETPFVAMQHASNRSIIQCCHYCFVPLVGDYVTQWEAIAARYNSTQTAATPVALDDLDAALQHLDIDKTTCGLAAPTVTCSGCDAVYCSKLCHHRAFHEFHAMLCLRIGSDSDSDSKMKQFLIHVEQTNDIFYLVAHVIAKLLSRFVQTRDVIKAREPMDMFYKKPWYEVVLLDKQLHHEADPTQTLQEESEAADNGVEAKCLRELLTHTHALLLDALEHNLVFLERTDQLHGLTTGSLWSECASILSFEFFAAQLGLFEMNNVRMEIDHPFRSLVEMLDSETESESEHPTVVARVRRVLEYEERRLVETQHPSAAPDERSHLTTVSGFGGVDGTALFPIICTMNHSCDPNCTVLYTNDGRAHVVAVRDIAAGDELCICYIDIDADVATRAANLREYQFKCFCARCSVERRQVRA